MALVIGKAGYYDYPYVVINSQDGVTEGADQILGTSRRDKIFAGGGNDIIKGGGGADWIYGGEGRDGASYEDSDTGVEVSLETGKGKGGTAEGDTLDSIEDLYGSKFNDTLLGDKNDNLLDGREGNDTLKGGGGHDVLKGGLGDDRLEIDGLDDDHAYGGDGNDTLVLNNGKQGAVVDLQSGYIRALTDNDPYDGYHGGYYGQHGGPHYYEETSHVWDVENVVGTNFEDHIYGSDVANSLSGNGGNDYLDGRGGNDFISGGAGLDTLVGGLGADVLSGGADADTFVWKALNESVMQNGKPQDVITDFQSGIDKIDICDLHIQDALILNNQNIGGTNYSLVGYDANGNGKFDDGEFVIAVQVANGTQVHQTDLIMV